MSCVQIGMSTRIVERSPIRHISSKAHMNNQDKSNPVRVIAAGAVMAALSLLAACAGAPTLSGESIAVVVASPDRSPGRTGTGISESGTLHRVEEAFVKQEVEAAGFRLAAQGNLMRNPADPRDCNTPEPPMSKDEFVVKFVKP